MKTSKKILALVLSLCMIFSMTTMLVSAKYVYNTNDLWGMWDENGQMTLKANINFSEGAASINFNGAVDSSLLYDSEVTSRYTVSFDFVIPGENPYTLSVKNAGIQGYNATEKINTVWFTSVLPMSGTICDNMIADAAADETLRGLLHVEDADPEKGIAGGVICKNDNTNKPVINGETSNSTYTELSKQNLLRYVGYKAGGVDNAKLSYHNTDVTITLTSPYVADYTIPAGSFFVDENDLVTFPYSWAVKHEEHTEKNEEGKNVTVVDVVGTYTLGNSSIITGLKDGGANLDLAYGVFEAPATGEYNVFAYKRDRVEFIDTAGNRDLHILINEEAYYFPCDNSPTAANVTPAYYWEIENADRADRATKTVSLVKGQKFVMRVPRTNRAYVGCRGFAFVPVEAEMTAATMQANKAKLPSSAANFNEYGWESYAESETKATVTVTVNGKQITAVADASNDSFPNSRLTDVSGNFIEGVTVLDALFAADAEDDAFELVAGTWGGDSNTKWTEGNIIDGAFADKKLIAKVNGVFVPEMDRYELQDGDVITVAAPEVVRLTVNGNGPTKWGTGGNTVTDPVYHETEAIYKFNISNYAQYPLWVDNVAAADSLANSYLIGIAPIKVDVSGTDGDERNFFNSFKYHIKHTAVKSDGTTLQLGYNGSTTTNVQAEDGKTYTRGLSTTLTDYDISNVYLAKDANTVPEVAKVTVKETDLGVIFYTDAPENVTVTRVAKDDTGKISSVSSENIALDLMSGGQFVPMSAGETMYIWRGGQLKTGTALIPICAPVIK